MTRRQLCITLVPLIAWMMTAAAHADLIVEFDSIVMQPSGVGSIDVFIRSSDGTDAIAQYNTQFEIRRISGQGILEFEPTARQSNSEIVVDNYVFFGDTNDFQSTRGDSTRNQLTQSDFASANVPVGVGLANRQLLGRLELGHILPADQIATFAGAVYEVSLVRGNQTFFNIDDFDTRVAIQESSYSNFGTITVAAVPEPSSGLLLLVALGIGLRRRRALGI